MVMWFRFSVIFIATFCISIFGYFVFSDAVNTANTDFLFLSGSNYHNYITVDLTGGTTGNAIVYLKNTDTVTISGKFMFVDGYTVSYGSTGLKACRTDTQNIQFGQYVSMVNPNFVLSAGASMTGLLNLIFPDNYSGIYNGCVVYGLYNTFASSGWNTDVRKAIFLDVDVSPGLSKFEVKTYPSNRQSGKWGNYGKLFFYSGNRLLPLFSGFVTTNESATGTYVQDIPSGMYDIVYKGQGQIGSYLSGVQITGGQTMLLDFTTGSNLYITKLEGSNETQIAGDILRDGKVNVSDITAVANVTCDYNATVTQYHECNLNGDTLVSIGDVTVVANNIGSPTGPFFAGVSAPEFGGFSW